MEEELFLGVVLRADLDQFLYVEEFKYLFFPVRYTHEKLPDLTASFDLLNFTFIFDRWLRLLFDILDQYELDDSHNSEYKVGLFFVGQFAEAFAKEFVDVGDFFGDFLFLGSVFRVVLKHLKEELDLERGLKFFFD